MYKQIKIYNFFKEFNQRQKLQEEFHEVVDAYMKFKAYGSEDNILHLFEELYDMINVLEGMAIVQYGLNLSDTVASKDLKLNRTIKLIEESKTIEEYEEKRKMI